VRAAGDLAAGVDTLERRLGVRVDDEAAVLVVEDGVGEDLLRKRVDSRGAIPAQHVGERELGIVLRDARRIEVDGGSSVGSVDALALRDLVDDRLRDDISRAKGVGELLTVGVQEHGAVRARRLRDAVALHRLRPGAAVRVVLERVEVACLDARGEGEARHLAGRAGMVRRELAPLLRLGEAAAAGGEDNRSGVDRVLAGTGAPAVLGAVELVQRALREERQAAGLGRLSQRGGDRVAGAVSYLEQALRRRAAAARKAVAAVLLRELDSELLEPVDGRCRLGGEDLDEAHVGRLVARGPDVPAVELGRVVLAEGRLDPALRLRGVARLDRALRRQRDAGAHVLGRDGCGQARGPAPDDEHVEMAGDRHSVRDSS
jgi:hypothetical protein